MEPLDRTRRSLAELRELFVSQFDIKWLHNLLDDLPIDATVFETTRQMFENDAAVVDDPARITEGLEALEAFATDLRRFLLPSIREKLGVSGLSPRFSLKDKDKMVVQVMVAYTFPHNLAKLEQLIADLRQQMLTAPRAKAKLPGGSEARDKAGDREDQDTEGDQGTEAGED